VAYSKQTWTDGPAGNTPVNASRLNHIEDGVAAAATATDLAANSTGDRQRSNHTGTQPATTITGLATVATSGAYADLSGRPVVPDSPDDIGAQAVATLAADVAAHVADGSALDVAIKAAFANRIVHIDDSGAVGNGTADDTAALQAFINANAGKAIYWPAKTYNVSQLLLPSNTHLELGKAVIRRTGNTAGSGAGGTLRNTDQSGGNSNITVRGGTITGNTGASGRPWSMVNVDGLRVEGLTITKGSATFTDFMFYFERCKNVLVDGFRLVGGTAVGEDGLHIKSSEDMVVTNGVVDAGDDALVLVHEFGQTAPIRNIAISNLTLRSTSAHLIRVSVFPTETQPIQDVTISNIVGHAPSGVTPSGNAVLIEDQTASGAGSDLIQRLTMDNIVINATGYPGNAVTIRATVDSTFSNWRVFGASNRSYLIDDCQRCEFTNVIADTPAVSTGNPQWTVNNSSFITLQSCESRDARIWGWVVGGAASTDITFIGCRAIGTAQQAWSIAYANRVSIIGCTVNGGSGVISCDTTNPPANLRVIGNQFAGYTGSALITPPGTLTYQANTDLSTLAFTSSNGELSGFYSALGNRHNAPCNILVLGDSFVEGQGATTIGNRWLDLFRDRFRDRFVTPGITGGVGFIPAVTAATTPTGQTFTTTGNTAIDFAGIGARTRVLGPTAGAGVGTMSITRTCTSFAIHHKPDDASAAFTVTIDGGAPVTVTGVAGEQVWSSSALADGAHSIVIAQSSGLAKIEGIMFYRGDETKGIRIWDSGRAGSRTGDWISGGTFGVTWADSIAKVTPDLVVIAFATNDVAAVTPTQYAADLTALITLVRSKQANVSIAIMPPFPRVAGGALAPWADYVSAAKAVAYATAQCVFLDVSDLFPTPSPDTYSLLSDGLHPNNRGHGLMAEAHLALLSPARP
jgi:lysophospholipase L1-like esterase/polygalacturonase